MYCIGSLRCFMLLIHIISIRNNFFSLTSEIETEKNCVSRAVTGNEWNQ